MSIGLMMAGQKSDTGKPVTERVDDDFYPTDAPITRGFIAAEIQRLRRYRVIDEPCCGDGAICHVLDEFGLRYRASNLTDRGFGKTGQDFLVTKKFSPAVVTNPPFKDDLPEKFIRHAMNCGVRYLALLLKEKFFYTQGRVDLFREFTPAREYKICWRPDFLERGGGTMDVSWWVWDLDNRDRPSAQPLIFLLSKNGRCV